MPLLAPVTRATCPSSRQREGSIMTSSLVGAMRAAQTLADPPLEIAMRPLLPASALLTLLLTACGGSDKTAPPQAAAPAAPPQKTVIDDQLKAIDKAKSVQGT